MMWRIMQISEGVIHRGWRRRWITSSEICVIHITRKPNSIIINNYWTRLSKISSFVCGEQINYLPKPKAEANNWSARHTDKSRYFAVIEFNNCFIIRSPSLFFLMNIVGRRSDLPFSRKSDRKKEKSTVSFTHEQNITCSQTLKPNTVGRHCAWADHYL